jgi:hypothetical protein
MPEVHTSSVVKSPLTPFIPGGGFSKGGNLRLLPFHQHSREEPRETPSVTG